MAENNNAGELEMRNEMNTIKVLIKASVLSDVDTLENVNACKRHREHTF